MVRAGPKDGATRFTWLPSAVDCVPDFHLLICQFAENWSKVAKYCYDSCRKEPGLLRVSIVVSSLLSLFSRTLCDEVGND